MVTKITVDFTNVKDASGINPKQMPEGDYAAIIRKVEEVDKKSGGKQLLFVIGLQDHANVSYPYYCGYEANVLWKLRNLMISAGVNAPKKAFSFDAEKLEGKALAISLTDDEYDGKMKSVIDAVFPLSELEAAEDEDDAPSPEANTELDDSTPADEADDELDLDSL